jgi:hypothetical protein
MPHCYSRFWLQFGNGAPLSAIWAWKDRAGSFPSWAPSFLAALEVTGCPRAAAEACGRNLRTVQIGKALLPGLSRAWAAALDRYGAAQLPIGQLPDASPIGESLFTELVHPLEELSMDAWLKLSDGEQIATVADYAGRTPRPGSAGDIRRRSGQ